MSPTLPGLAESLTLTLFGGRISGLKSETAAKVPTHPVASHVTFLILAPNVRGITQSVPAGEMFATSP